MRRGDTHVCRFRRGKALTPRKRREPGVEVERGVVCGLDKGNIEIASFFPEGGGRRGGGGSGEGRWRGRGSGRGRRW